MIGFIRRARARASKHGRWLEPRVRLGLTRVYPARRPGHLTAGCSATELSSRSISGTTISHQSYAKKARSRPSGPMLMQCPGRSGFATSASLMVRLVFRRLENGLIRLVGLSPRRYVDTGEQFAMFLHQAVTNTSIRQVG